MCSPSPSKVCGNCCMPTWTKVGFPKSIRASSGGDWSAKGVRSSTWVEHSPGRRLWSGHTESGDGDDDVELPDRAARPVRVRRHVPEWLDNPFRQSLRIGRRRHPCQDDGGNLLEADPSVRRTLGRQAFARPFGSRGPRVLEATDSVLSEERLPGEPDRLREEGVQRVHGLAGLHELVEELRVHDLVVAEAMAGDEILPAEILDHRMVRIIPWGRPLEGFPAEFDPRAQDFLPRVRLLDDSVADLLEDRRVGMPDPGVDATLSRLQVEEISGSHVLRRRRFVVPEMDPHMGLVRALVRGEADVPVDAGDGSSKSLRFPDEVRADLLQSCRCITDEAHRRFLDDLLVSGLVRLEPFLAVVLLEFPEELEEARREISGVVGHLARPLRAVPE